MRNFKKVILITSLSTLTFLSQSFAGSTEGCQSLANSHWHGNVSSENGSVSRKIDIEIQYVVLNTSQGKDYYYDLVGTLNGKTLSAHESTCWDNHDSNNTKMRRVDFANESGMDFTSHHPLPTQIPLSGLIRKDEQDKPLETPVHVDGMIMKS